MNQKKWRSHWNILKRFSVGYDARATVMTSAGSVSDPDGVAPEEAYWMFQERGEMRATTDAARVTELLQRKSAMDLTVAMWKETIRDYQRATSAYERLGAPQAMVMELSLEFPVSFLNGVGLLKMVGLTLRQLGLRLSRNERALRTFVN